MSICFVVVVVATWISLLALNVFFPLVVSFCCKHKKSLNYKAIGFVIVVVISISCFIFDFFSIIAIGVEGFSFFSFRLV